MTTQHANCRRGHQIERFCLGELANGPATFRQLAIWGDRFQVSQTGIFHALQRLVAKGRVEQSATRQKLGSRWPAWVYTRVAVKERAA